MERFTWCGLEYERSGTGGCEACHLEGDNCAYSRDSGVRKECVGNSVDAGPCYKAIKPTTAAERVDSRIQELAKAIEGLPKDPKTKYHRPMYPAWNDTEVHTDANGHKYINVDVYSVLAAFDPGHEVAHAVKKLLAAGSRDKGSKIQDYREAIISIEAAIYRAEIEGGAA